MLKLREESLRIAEEHAFIRLGKARGKERDDLGQHRSPPTYCLPKGHTGRIAQLEEHPSIRDEGPAFLLVFEGSQQPTPAEPAFSR